MQTSDSGEPSYGGKAEGITLAQLTGAARLSAQELLPDLCAKHAAVRGRREGRLAAVALKGFRSYQMLWGCFDV